MTTTQRQASQTAAPLGSASAGPGSTAPRAGGRPKLSEKKRDGIAGYLFLTPWLIGFFVLTLGPMLISLYLAFTKYNLFTDPEWIGFDNFTRMFNDPQFQQSVQITLTYVLVGTPIKLAAALGVAMLLNYRSRGSGFFRSAFYAPSLIGASVSVAIVWRAMFNNDGPVDTRMIASVEDARNVLSTTFGIALPNNERLDAVLEAALAKGGDA